MNKELSKIKKESQNIIKEKNKTSNLLSNLRLILFIITFFTIFISLTSNNYIGLLISIIFLIIFIIIAIYHEIITNQIKKQEFFISTITKYENRTNNKWQEEPSENIDNLDNFINDLDIINGNSLFKYLNFTNSLGSKNLLIKSLSLKNKITPKEIISNQESIQELSNKKDFILNFQYILSNIPKIETIDYKEYFYFFNNKKSQNKIEFLISIIISIISIIIGILSIFNILPIYYLLLLICIQLIHSYSYKLRYSKQLNNINECSKIYSNLNNIYSFISKQEFTSEKNKLLQEKIIKGENILKEINKISSLNTLRFNFITNIILSVFSSLLLIIINKYNRLLNKDISTFKESINALESYELLISLSTIGIVKENTSFPIIDKNWNLNAQSVMHPLLKENACIANDFLSKKDINIITGSNMSGKTSFMKTIGINLILAYNGTYVNAKTFNCPIAKIFTSINVKDDINKGISTFYAELKRIKDILDYSKNNDDKLIIFIDEIFKGTNYNDRILGAKETLNQLVNINCLVFLTTHDFELCEISKKAIKNYHFSEKYINNKIVFDYQIKEGKCQTTNAQYLMKQMGIIKNKSIS